MKKIFRVVALCVVIGCTGSVMGAGAEHCMQQDAGRYVAPADAGGSAKASPTQAAMWAAPAAEEESGLTWYQVAGILALLGGGGALGWTGCKKMQAIRLEPQPLEVQMSKDYVTRSEFEEYRKQVASDIERVHKRLDTVMPAVAEIKGELKQIAQKQTQILNLLLNGKASA